MAFPNLSVQPYPIKESRDDSTIRYEFEGGYEHTRARYTRVRKIFTLEYHLLPDADKVLIENHVNSVSGGADSFDWTHPKTSTVYSVRYSKLPEFEYRVYDYWKTTIILKEV